jgi:sugar lactone lactonase YvrE
MKLSFVLCSILAGALFASGSRAQIPGYEVRVLAGRPLFGNTDGPAGTATFASPRSVAADNEGNVFVADSLNHTIRKITRAGVVSTLAGSAGSPGSADGTGTAARFAIPAGVAVDPAGNLFVADLQNHTIRRITPAGVVSTIAGLAGVAGAIDGSGSQARFSSPVGVTVDRAGNLYVADMDNHVIRKISSVGSVTTFAGRLGSGGDVDGPAGDARFQLPISVAADPTGNVYVVDISLDTVRKITPDGMVTTIAGGPGGSNDGDGRAARFSFPLGVGADNAGNIYVADSFNQLIRRISPSAAVTTVAGKTMVRGTLDATGREALFDTPSAVTVDGAGNVFVADLNNNTIRQIAPSGAVTTLAGRRSAGADDGAGDAARFDYPQGTAVDLAGNTYVADTFNHTVRKITPAGAVSTLAGAAGQIGNVDGKGDAARFESPTGVAVDRAGNLYVSTLMTVRKVTPAGDVTTLAGQPGVFGSADGLGAAASFAAPHGLAVAADGTLYVADRENATIRKITPAGLVSTLAGAARQPGGADGIGAAARFMQPAGLALDGAGNLYVSDRGSFTLRKITPSGVVSTIAGQHGVSGIADGAGSAARFHLPTGIAIDRLGVLYVADGNNTIRQVTPAGIVTTLAPKFGGIERSDDTAIGKISFTTGIATDLAGNLYFTDAGNNTIRKAVSTTRAINLSVRTRIGTDDQTPILGFLVASSSPKPMVLRGVGPGLTSLGVASAAADPQLKLFNFSATQIQENDNWGGSASLRQAFDAVGAFPLEAASKDAALLTALPTGLYSMQLTATGAPGGVALMEAYDAEANATGRLTNVSVRTFAGTGDTTLIAGFVLAGTAPKTLLIRAAGPSLARLGVGASGLLADPKLTVFRGSTSIDTNDNWGGTAELKAVFRSVGAFDFDSDASKDSALLTTLLPGAYTVQVTGANAGTGVAVVEIYELP